MTGLLMGLPPHTREAVPSSPPRAHPQVYPRTRGEATLTLPLQVAVAGLPPHTRGSQADDVAHHLDRRSTPAHAGKPAPPGG